MYTRNLKGVMSHDLDSLPLSQTVTPFTFSVFDS